MILNGLKSKTFWGVALTILIAILKTKGIVPTDPALIIGSVTASLAFYGARNTKKKS